MTGKLTLNGVRVLIVEDDFYLATDEKRLIEEAGAKAVGPSAHSEDACRLISEGQVDCALLDINLGSGPSYSVAAALQARNLPFLFTTGYDASSIPEEWRHVERLEKPVRDQDLLSALERLVATH